MDSDHSAEDLNHDRAVTACQICHQSFDPSSPAYQCILCTKKTCESCSVSQENPVLRYCSKCYKFLPYLSSTSVQQLQLETIANFELSSKVSTIQKEINLNNKKLLKLDREIDSIPEKETIIKAIQGEVQQNIEKIHEISRVIKQLSEENEEMDKFIQEKEEEIENLTRDIIKSKEEAMESKKNSNTIPPECNELYLENQDLKDKLKELENEQISYTQQLIEVLEMLKLQVAKEKSENFEIKSETEDTTDPEIKENLEQEKIRIRELQEELRIARRQLELMRGSRIEEKPFAGRREKLHDKKKCEIF